MSHRVDSYSAGTYHFGAVASRQLGVAVLGVTMLATVVPSEAAPAVTSTPFRICVSGQPSLSRKQVLAVTALAGAVFLDRTSRYGWTSGFFPAEVWMMYQSARTKSARKVWLARARRASEVLLPLASYDAPTTWVSWSDYPLAWHATGSQW